MMFSITFLSSLGVLSTQSWFMIWVFMEINMLAFSSFLYKKEKEEMNTKTPSTMIYIIIQALSSTLLLMCCVLNMKTLFTILILLKMGVWPFQMWYVITLNNMSFKKNSSIMLMSWQKLIPMFLFTCTAFNFTNLLLISSTLVMPTIMLKNCTNMKKTIMLSSVNNNSWFMLSTFSSMMCMVLYFFSYLVSLISLMKNINFKNLNNPSKFNIWMNFIPIINLSGIPPMILFTAKLLLIIYLLTLNMKEMCLLIMITSCMFCFFYLTNSLTWMMKTPKKNQVFLMKNTKTWNFMIILSSSLPFLLFL